MTVLFTLCLHVHGGAPNVLQRCFMRRPPGYAFITTHYTFSSACSSYLPDYNLGLMYVPYSGVSCFRSVPWLWFTLSVAHIAYDIPRLFHAQISRPSMHHNYIMLLYVFFFGPFLIFCQETTFDLFFTMCAECSIASDCTGCGSTDSGFVPTCDLPLDHTSAIGEGNTLESLRIDWGYWRATNESDRILQCYNTDACRGGETAADDFCASGYSGPCKGTTVEIHVCVWV